MVPHQKPHQGERKANSFYEDLAFLCTSLFNKKSNYLTLEKFTIGKYTCYIMVN